MIHQSFFTVSKIKNFSAFYSNASKYRNTYFLTYMSFKKSLETCGQVKFAVVTSKKGVHKRAVKRNFARRRLKTAFRNYLKTASLPFGVEIQVLFMANRTVLDAPWEELTTAIHFVMQKVLLRCNSFLEDNNAF